MGVHRFQMGGQGITAPPLATTLVNTVVEDHKDTKIIIHNQGRIK